MNATIPQPAPAETQAERTARHLAMCRDIGDTAMQLAREAAARFLNPEQDATPPDATPKARPKGPDLIQAFIRLATILHKNIALECRIARGDAPRGTRPAQSAGTRAGSHPPDSRRQNLTAALDYATEKRPDRAAIRREAQARMDQQLADRPDAETGELFNEICNDLAIQIDYARMPDKILTTLMPTGYVQPTSFELPEGWQKHAYPHLHPD